MCCTGLAWVVILMRLPRRGKKIILGSLSHYSQPFPVIGVPCSSLLQTAPHTRERGVTWAAISCDGTAGRDNLIMLTPHTPPWDWSQCQGDKHWIMINIYNQWSPDHCPPPDWLIWYLIIISHSFPPPGKHVWRTPLSRLHPDLILSKTPNLSSSLLTEVRDFRSLLW